MPYTRYSTDQYFDDDEASVPLRLRGWTRPCGMLHGTAASRAARFFLLFQVSRFDLDPTRSSQMLSFQLAKARCDRFLTWFLDRKYSRNLMVRPQRIMFHLSKAPSAMQTRPALDFSLQRICPLVPASSRRDRIHILYMKHMSHSGSYLRSCLMPVRLSAGRRRLLWSQRQSEGPALLLVLPP